MTTIKKAQRMRRMWGLWATARYMRALGVPVEIAAFLLAGKH